MATATTPPFPPNGPGTEAFFDSHKLLLLNVACPPDTLDQHVAMLGKEFDPPSRVLDCDLDVPWPLPADSPLRKVISREAVLEWDYDLFKLRDLSDGHPLVYMAHGIIDLFDLVNKLKLDEAALHRLEILHQF
jgi:hypothetical protein